MKTLIIAEAGVNHNGDMGIAKELISAAASAGADIVKFQTFVSDKIALSSAPKALYQKKVTDPDETQQEMLKKLELSREQHLELVAECKKHGINFLSTAFDLESIQLLEDVCPLKLVKVPSGEITNVPYLRRLTRNRLPVLLSTGMATLGEIEFALGVIADSGTKIDDVTVLHCSSQYPTPKRDVNLRAMVSIRDAFKLNVGYSDHTIGIEVPIAAVALGASVIEKHITLNRDLPGPDQFASLEPEEFDSMVQGIRNIEKALGNGIKRPTPGEVENKSVVRKSIVAACPIKSGEIFTEDNIVAKRPGSGISAAEWDKVLGLAAKRDFDEDQLIEL